MEENLACTAESSNFSESGKRNTLLVYEFGNIRGMHHTFIEINVDIQAMMCMAVLHGERMCFGVQGKRMHSRLVSCEEMTSFFFISYFLPILSLHILVQRKGRMERKEGRKKRREEKTARKEREAKEKERKGKKKQGRKKPK